MTEQLDPFGEALAEIIPYMDHDESADMDAITPEQAAAVLQDPERLKTALKGYQGTKELGPSPEEHREEQDAILEAQGVDVVLHHALNPEPEERRITDVIPLLVEKVRGQNEVLADILASNAAGTNSLSRMIARQVRGVLGED